MKSYVFRYKKLMDRTPNNYRKMHGQPMRRWVQLRKLYDARATCNAKAYKRAIASIKNISEAFSRVNAISHDDLRDALGMYAESKEE